MTGQDNKLKNYSIASDLIKLILLIIAGLVIGHLFNQFLYGLIFSLCIFIIYIIYLRQKPMVVDSATPPWRVVPSISGGGLFFDLASHQLDLLEFLFGPIEKAYGTAASRLSSYDAEDTVSASFQFS